LSLAFKFPIEFIHSLKESISHPVYSFPAAANNSGLYFAVGKVAWR